MGWPVETIDSPGFALLLYKFPVLRLSLRLWLQTCPKTLCLISI